MHCIPLIPNKLRRYLPFVAVARSGIRMPGLCTYIQIIVTVAEHTVTFLEVGEGGQQSQGIT